MNPIQRRSLTIIGIFLLAVAVIWAVFNFRAPKVLRSDRPGGSAVTNIPSSTEETSWLAGENTITIVPEDGWSVQQNTPKTAFSLTTSENPDDVTGRIDFSLGEITLTTDGEPAAVGSKTATMWLENDTNMSVADVDYLRRWYTYKLELDELTTVKITVSVLAPTTEEGEKKLDKTIATVKKMLSNATIE